MIWVYISKLENSHKSKCNLNKKKNPDGIEIAYDFLQNLC